MNWFRWFRREDDERQLRREVEAHLAERVDDLREGGLSEAEARTQARREFGNAVLHLEASREVWHRRWLVDARRDAQYATRTLSRHPGFTAAAVLTLALGIGAHTALFSVVNAIALQPIPVARIDGVYSVQAVRPTGQRAPSVSLAGLRALERELPDGALAVVGAVGYSWWPLAQIPGRAETLCLSTVSGGYASAFDLPPQLGRWITADDDRDGAPQHVVVISDRLWREWFAANPSIVGRAFLTIQTTPFRVIGVAPAGFAGLLPAGVVRTDAWMSICRLDRRVPDGIAPPGGNGTPRLPAVLLVMGAGLFIEEIRKDLSRRLYVHYEGAALAAARVDMALHDYPEARGRVFFDRLLSEVRGLTGVERVALADAIPGSRSGPARTTIVADDPPGGRAGEPARINAAFMRVSAGFFDTVGVGLRVGRDFGPGDAEGAPLVAIVSESAADALWPGRDPVGQRFVLDTQPVTIIGVSPNLVSGLTGPREEYPGSERFPATRPSNYVFVPFAQHYQASMFVMVRGPGQAQADALRAAVRRVDEQVAVLEASTVSSQLRWLGAVWSAAVVMLTLAAVALTIAMLGVYGVVSFFVSSRMHEFGIRLALGATPRGLMKLVFDYSLHIVLVGLLPAVFIAAVASRLIESRQFDLMPNDTTTWVAVPLLLVAAALVAGYFPARRASRVDPNLTLRSL